MVFLWIELELLCAKTRALASPDLNTPYHESFNTIHSLPLRKFMTGWYQI